MIPLKSSDRTAPSGARRHGFTLVELMISSGIFVVMISLVMGMVVMQSRFGVSLGHYADMNEYSRKAMTRFEKDMRLVLNVEPGFSDTEVKANLLSPATVAAVVKGPLPVTRVAYAYVPAPSPGASGGKLYRRQYDTTGALVAQEVVLDNLIACKLLYFNKNDVLYDGTNFGTADVKKVLLAATMRRSFVGIATTDYLVSSVVTMRCRNNK